MLGCDVLHQCGRMPEKEGDMVEEIEKALNLEPVRAGHPDAAPLQKKVRAGLLAEQRLDDGSVSPWEISTLRKRAIEGRKAQLELRRHGHDTSLPDEAQSEDQP
jgi:hypothetical protein